MCWPCTSMPSVSEHVGPSGEAAARPLEVAITSGTTAGARSIRFMDLSFRDVWEDDGAPTAEPSAGRRGVEVGVEDSDLGDGVDWQPVGVCGTVDRFRARSVVDAVRLRPVG